MSGYGIDRPQAWDLVQQHIQNENLRKHCLASEAVLRALAARLGEDPELWGLAGLLHDLDVELTGGDLNRHTLETERLLTAAGVSPVIIDAVKRHNRQAHGLPRETRLHHALAAGETITGLVTATALVYPDRKLASVKPKSVVKRMKESHFAARVNRDHIRECERLGLTVDEFAELAVTALRGISGQLGL